MRGASQISAHAAARDLRRSALGDRRFAHALVANLALSTRNSTAAAVRGIRLSVAAWTDRDVTHTSRTRSGGIVAARVHGHALARRNRTIHAGHQACHDTERQNRPGAEPHVTHRILLGHT